MEMKGGALLRSGRWLQQTPWESATSAATAVAPVSSTLGLWVSSTASLLRVFKTLGQASMVSFSHPTKVGQSRGQGMANTSHSWGLFMRTRGPSQSGTRTNWKKKLVEKEGPPRPRHCFGGLRLRPSWRGWEKPRSDVTISATSLHPTTL